jgi:hypothetical protein
MAKEPSVAEKSESPVKPEPDRREDRLAAALRANLRRRKAVDKAKS